MVKRSGFSFCFNPIAAGMPIVEAVRAVEPFVDEMVVVDAGSTDGTREILEQLGVTILDAEWGNEAGETLKRLHAMHTECKHDIIVHAEADEVWDHLLLKNVCRMMGFPGGSNEFAVYRIQLEQNFQRIREYPTPVHRVFKKGTAVKDGRTTNTHNDAHIIPASQGYLWDITNCFRNNWLKRVKQNGDLWNEENPKYRYVPEHFVMEPEIKSMGKLDEFLKQDHWTWTTTPIKIPAILLKLVGQPTYLGRV